MVGVLAKVFLQQTIQSLPPLLLEPRQALLCFQVELAFRVREGPATPNDKVEVREWTYERIGMGGGCTNSVRVC